MEINKSSKASFSYEGTVILQVMKGQQVITTKKYHNRGLSAFFKGLCMLLTNQENLSSLIPNTIALYTFSDESLVAANPPHYSWDQLTQVNADINDFTTLTPLIRISPYLPINASFVKTTAETTAENTSAGTKYTAVLQFSIPYSLISSDRVYALALYPRFIDNQTPEPCALAFYPITNNAGQWDPIPIQKASNNAAYNLLIEWQMDFENI